mmetsp:Transcript_47038/g.117305  ORF Transcript_47038/g.117305 Transcript_47038/m.117305 type:complete len:147 (-) Transcript_47038:3530-3970(-)
MYGWMRVNVWHPCGRCTHDERTAHPDTFTLTLTRRRVGKGCAAWHIHDLRERVAFLPSLWNMCARQPAEKKEPSPYGREAGVTQPPPNNRAHSMKLKLHLPTYLQTQHKHAPSSSSFFERHRKEEDTHTYNGQTTHCTHCSSQAKR